jgi:trigger factor
MSVTIEIAGPCRKKLRVEISAERVAGARAEIVREFRRVAELPGFRPGKAPEPMVEKRYAREIDEEVRKKLIPDTYREAIAEQKLRVVGMPQIEKVECQPGQPLIYTAVVDVAPEFALPEYKGIAVTRKEVVVTGEDVTKMLDALREEQADFVAVEGRGVKTGDFAVINYSGIADGKPIAELVPENKGLGAHEGFWVLVESDSFLPGFCDQLLGATAGEKRQVLINFPADFPQKQLAGRKATYFVDVTAIKEKKLAELNDEFAKKAGAESVEKLQEEVRKGIARERELQAQADLRNQIVDQLLKQTQFDLPDSLVAAETRSIVYDVVRENTMRGVSREELEQKKNDIFGFASQSAKDRLRASFILDAIAEKEKISVAEHELDERIAEIARRNRSTPERIKAQLVEHDEMGQIEDQVRVAKTLDFLMANAKVEALK